MSEMNKIGAVVVTYNRRHLLEECIEALRHQSRAIDEIVVVNNGSTDDTADWLKIQKDLNVIHQGNVGGSGGFYTGMQAAFDAGCDWIWIMDDDAHPRPDALEKLLEHAGLDDIVALGSLKINPEGEVLLHHQGYFNFRRVYRGSTQLPAEMLTEKTIDLDFLSFVGLMISSNAIRKIGLPKREMFIYSDDAEYCARLRKIGKILLVTSSIIIHHEKLQKKLSLSERISEANSRDIKVMWRYFYGIRNLTYLGTAFATCRWRFYIDMCMDFVKKCTAVWLFCNKKWLRTKILFYAYHDGVLSKFDNARVKALISQ